MSNNLDLDQMAENQSAPEVTHNDSNAALDAALTEQLDVDVAAGNATVTSDDYRGHIRFNITTATSAGRTVTLPAVKRVVFVSSDSANTKTVAIVVGATSVAIHPGTTYVVVTDGTADGLAIATFPFDMSAFIPGLPDDGGVILIRKAVRPFTLPASLSGSFVTAAVAATAQADFNILKNGVSIGTIRFAASGTTATFVGISATTFLTGDVLKITAPTPQDATLADVAIDLKGTR